MRILHLAGEYPPLRLGGIATMLEGLVREQRASHEVGVVVLRGVDYHREGDAAGAQLVELDAAGLARGALLDQRALEAAVGREGLLGERWDVLHAHDWYGVLPAVAVRGGARTPMVMSAHLPLRYGFTYANHPLPAREKARIEALGFRQSRRVIAPSRAIATLLEREYDVPREKLRVAHNGVDTDRFAPGGGVPTPTFLSVSRLTEQKGIELLVEAFADVAARLPTARLEIAGEGPSRAAIEARVRELGLDTCVRLLGHVPHAELPALYRRAWAFVSASVYEPFGLTTLEALACGTPAIVSPLGGGPEIVHDGREGLVRWPHDRGALARAMIDLANDAERRAAMSRAARERALELSWRACAARVEACYREAMEEA